MSAACGKKETKPGELPAGAPPAFATAPAVGPEVTPATFEAAGEAGAGRDDRAPSDAGGGQLAQRHGSAVRAARRAAQGCARAHSGALVALGSVLPARRPAPSATASSAAASDPGSAARRTTKTSPSRPCTNSRAGSSNASSRRSGSRHLSATAGALQSQAALRHHADARPGAGAGQARPTRKSPRASIADRCTAFRGARKTCSIPPASRRPTAPSRSATACRPTTPRWCSV